MKFTVGLNFGTITRELEAHTLRFCNKLPQLLEEKLGSTGVKWVGWGKTGDVD